ncbi:MAG: hypothetical protein HKM06_04270, partial [Spirochaetales bacterium]|nr:hypothetical protein [Spirochaetales bacterium]
MKRFLGLIVVLVGFSIPLWAQTSWKGQAEVWSDATLPLDGYYVASDQFPRNTVLIVENYKTRKTVQVRVVSGLPEGSACLVKLSPKAATALGMAPGDSVPVSVQIDTSLEGYLASTGDQSWKTDTTAPSNPSTAVVESQAKAPVVVPLAAPLAPAVATGPSASEAAPAAVPVSPPAAATPPPVSLPADNGLPPVPAASEAASQVFLTPPPPA